MLKCGFLPAFFLFLAKIIKMVKPFHYAAKAILLPAAENTSVQEARLDFYRPVSSNQNNAVFYFF
ncbi:hypothetical protein D920_02811 [Enterococcus faecalis 13-SD-W-01]|nr:hypothetical protein D920_02811 [Enterococcus faecalis 13-SD-W-01]